MKEDVLDKEIGKIMNANHTSRIVISVETKFKKFTEKDFDKDSGDKELILTEDMEKRFHDAVHKAVEDWLIDGESFSEEVLNEMCEYEMIPEKGIDNFSDFGKVNIRIVKLKTLDKEKK